MWDGTDQRTRLSYPMGKENSLPKKRKKERKKEK
jgi:hypothetical protein